MTPRSPTRMLAGHCDRYVVTLASPGETMPRVGVGPARGTSDDAPGGPADRRGRIEALPDRPLGACDVRFENPLYPAPH